MDATPEPSQPAGESRTESREELRVTVRRSPKYGIFMAIGAVLGILAAWIISSASTPGVNEAGQRVDTTPVIGLMLVVGFVVGGVVGGVVAIVVDRALGKRTRTVLAERTETHEPEPVDEPADVADAGEAAFEPLDEPASGSAPGTAAPEDDRPREA